MQRQLWWLGHVIRMPSNRLPRNVLYGELLRGSGVTRVSCARGQKRRSASPPRATDVIRHVVSVSIGADERKISRGLVHFAHPGTMWHVGMLLWGMGCYKLPDGVWGEAPAANGFCFFCAMKRILWHKNVNYWRLVAGWTQGQNIGMRGWGLETSWLAKSAPIYAGMAITQYIHQPIPSGVVVVGVAPSPRYFQYEKKLCKKHFVQVLD